MTQDHREPQDRGPEGDSAAARRNDERLADWVDDRLNLRHSERFAAEMRVDPELKSEAERYRSNVERMREALLDDADESPAPEFAARLAAVIRAEGEPGASPAGEEPVAFGSAERNAEGLEGDGDEAGDAADEGGVVLRPSGGWGAGRWIAAAATLAAAVVVAKLSIDPPPSSVDTAVARAELTDEEADDVSVAYVSSSEGAAAEESAVAGSDLLDNSDPAADEEIREAHLGAESESYRGPLDVEAPMVEQPPTAGQPAEEAEEQENPALHRVVGEPFDDRSLDDRAGESRAAEEFLGGAERAQESRAPSEAEEGSDQKRAKSDARSADVDPVVTISSGLDESRAEDPNGPDPVRRRAQLDAEDQEQSRVEAPDPAERGRSGAPSRGAAGGRDRMELEREAAGAVAPGGGGSGEVVRGSGAPGSGEESSVNVEKQSSPSQPRVGDDLQENLALLEESEADPAERVVAPERRGPGDVVPSAPVPAGPVGNGPVGNGPVGGGPGEADADNGVPSADKSAADAEESGGWESGVEEDAVRDRGLPDVGRLGRMRQRKLGEDGAPAAGASAAGAVGAGAVGADDPVYLLRYELAALASAATEHFLLEPEAVAGRSIQFETLAGLILKDAADAGAESAMEAEVAKASLNVEEVPAMVLGLPVPSSVAARSSRGLALEFGRPDYSYEAGDRAFWIGGNEAQVRAQLTAVASVLRRETKQLDVEVQRVSPRWRELPASKSALFLRSTAGAPSPTGGGGGGRGSDGPRTPGPGGPATPGPAPVSGGPAAPSPRGRPVAPRTGGEAESEAPTQAMDALEEGLSFDAAADRATALKSLLGGKGAQRAATLRAIELLRERAERESTAELDGVWLVLRARPKEGSASGGDR